MQRGEGLLPSPLLAMLEKKKKSYKNGFSGAGYAVVVPGALRGCGFWGAMCWGTAGRSPALIIPQSRHQIRAVKAGGREDRKEKETFLGVGLPCRAPCKAVLSVKYIL